MIFLISDQQNQFDISLGLEGILQPVGKTAHGWGGLSGGSGRGGVAVSG